jgi:hypothetical protein
MFYFGHISSPTAGSDDKLGTTAPAAQGANTCSSWNPQIERRLGVFVKFGHVYQHTPYFSI